MSDHVEAQAADCRMASTIIYIYIIINTNSSN